MLSACAKAPQQIAVHYHLEGLPPSDVMRVQTMIKVDPSDPRQFFADQPFRSVGSGIGMEVRDLDGTGARSVLITHDATLGYTFKNDFTFTVLAPAGGAPPTLLISAFATDASAQTIGSSTVNTAAFKRSGAIDLHVVSVRCGDTACGSDRTCCANRCSSLNTDPQNCGSCGRQCSAAGGDSCTGGVCRCGAASACAAGQVCCSGLGCVDTRTDPFHCGDCLTGCKPGESCVAGQCSCNGGPACDTGTSCCNGLCTNLCTCGGTSCAPNEVCCGTICSNPLTDDANCGSCDRRCTPPLACSGGACTCRGMLCAPTDACCTSGCANFNDDPINCGGCARPCRPGEQCVSGQCVCGSSSDRCDSSQICCGTQCVQYLTDVLNCGSCGRRCKTNEVCMNGNCFCNGAPGCTGPNDTCCPAPGRLCSDLSSDTQHCGSCDRVCNPGQMCCGGVCTSQTVFNCGVCGAMCPGGWRCCPPVASEGYHCVLGSVCPGM